MRRALTATAVLAATSGIAQAQSSVTIYGLVDAAIEHINTSGAGGVSVTRMPGLTGSLPSRLGFRGVEDLGNGLRAVFTLESGFGVDSGTLNQGGRGFGRQTFVGLQGPWGGVTLGRQYSMLYWSQFDADILGPSVFGSGSLDSYLPNARVDNSIAYRGKFGPFNVGATYSLGRDAVNAGPSPSGTNCPGENNTDSKACKQSSAMVKYDVTDWGVVAAVDQIRGGPGAFAGLTSSAMKDRRSTIAGWFKIGDVKFGTGVIARRNGANTPTPRSNLWYVGASYFLTPSVVLEGQVFKLDYKKSANEATLAAVRATYLLSKRSAVYITAGHIANEGSLAISVSGAAAGGAPPAGRNQQGIAMGIRHSF